jgi:hypothetical protein
VLRNGIGWAEGFGQGDRDGKVPDAAGAQDQNAGDHRGYDQVGGQLRQARDLVGRHRGIAGPGP